MLDVIIIQVDHNNFGQRSLEDTKIDNSTPKISQFL